MDHLLTGTILGDYEVKESIGCGGMGVVYRAHQLSLDRPVAIKVLPPEFCTDHDYVSRFMREARAAANLNHPNIIQVLDAGVSENIYFFVMEYVDGKNLGQVVRERGRLKEYEALCIMYEVTRGLAFAHSMGIIHRDVKPENIMLTNRRTVKIGDLGLAKWKLRGVDLALTSDGASMGTPRYVSPEQIRALKDIDARADIYSLGMTFDHLLRGRPAFCDGTDAEIMARHLSDEIPPLHLFNSEITLSTLELLTALTVKDRESRIQEMSDVTDMISQMLGFQQEERTGPGRSSIRRTRATAKPQNFWSRLRKVSRRVFIDVIAVMVGLAVAVGLWMVSHQYWPTEKQKHSQAAQSEESAPSAQNTPPTTTTDSGTATPAMPSQQNEESAFARRRMLWG